MGILGILRNGNRSGEGQLGTGHVHDSFLYFQLSGTYSTAVLPQTHFSHVMSDVPNRLERPLLLGDKETEGTFDEIPVM